MKKYRFCSIKQAGSIYLIYYVFDIDKYSLFLFNTELPAMKFMITQL